MMNLDTRTLKKTINFKKVKDMHKNTLTEGPVLRRLLSFALPILGANLLQALYGTVDLMVVGRFADASAVSAVSTGSMTMQTITGIVIGLSISFPGCFAW